MLPKKIKLNQDAYSRLKAIEEYTQLGSGYKIANMDLSIRGGGSVFGYDQSGNIENIGYELVSKFVHEYINADNIKVKINFINKGMIPKDYLESEKLRLLIYRKIKSIQSFNELEILCNELNDRFGKIPPEVIKIIEIQKIYILCHNVYINLIDEKSKFIIIQFQANYWKKKISSLLNKINEFVDKHEINYRVEEFKDSLILKLNKNNHNDSVDIVAKLINMFEPRNLI